jgi:hypothetical protein
MGLHAGPPLPGLPVTGRTDAGRDKRNAAHRADRTARRRSRAGEVSVGTIADLVVSVTREQRANPNCDRATMVVIDLPDGSSWEVASVTYQEDLAGALVIKAGRQLPGWIDPPGKARD